MSFNINKCLTCGSYALPTGMSLESIFRLQLILNLKKKLFFFLIISYIARKKGK